MSYCHASFTSSWRTNLCSIDRWNDRSPYSSYSDLLCPFFYMTTWLFWIIKWNPPFYLCSSTLLRVVKDATGVVCGTRHPIAAILTSTSFLLYQRFLCNLKLCVCVGGELFCFYISGVYTFEETSSHDTNVVELFPSHWIWSWKENIQYISGYRHTIPYFRAIYWSPNYKYNVGLILNQKVV